MRQSLVIGDGVTQIEFGPTYRGPPGNVDLLELKPQISFLECGVPCNKGDIDMIKDANPLHPRPFYAGIFN
jgi:hypothetical protein